MTDFAWSIPLRPDALRPDTMSWTIQKAGVAFRSPYAGSVESVTFPGWYWKISVTLPPRLSVDGGELEAFFEGLAGADDAVLVYHWLRPVPRGTMRGAPTVAVAAVRGDRQIVIATTGTLMAGDLFKVGNTVHKARASCTPVGGQLTVPLVARMRKPAVIGDPVGWDHPTVRCVMPAFSHSSAYQAGGVMASTPIDLEEAP